jgi:hypothetical protein
LHFGIVGEGKEGLGGAECGFEEGGWEVVVVTRDFAVERREDGEVGVFREAMSMMGMEGGMIVVGLGVIGCGGSV